MLRSAFSALLLSLCASLYAASPNGLGVSMGHEHFNARDLNAHRQFWTMLGAKPDKPIGTNEAYAVQDGTILVRKQDPEGPVAGSIITHVGFRVKSLAGALDKCRAAGYKILTPADQTRKSHKANVLGPDDINVELVEDQSLTGPIATHHIHFYASPVDDVRAWYVRLFGAVAGKRDAFEAADLPGVNLTFSPSDKRLATTKGTAMDHIGFEVKNLQAFCKKLEAQGIKFDRPYTPRPDLGIALAFLTDPWGTYIELTEPLQP